MKPIMQKGMFLTLIFLGIAVLSISGCKRSLTATNANKIIPNGMSESDVYAILGTNAVVSPDNYGRKHLIYFFQFFPPPGINIKIASLQVIVSNGVVVETIVPRVYQR
jgi:hypothetical protein